MVTLQIEYDGFHISEEQIAKFAEDLHNLFEWLWERVQRGIEALKDVCKRFSDAIKNDARRICDAITEMLDNYDEAMKVEQSRKFYYGGLSVKVTDSSFYLPKVNTKPIWVSRKWIYKPRCNC